MKEYKVITAAAPLFSQFRDSDSRPEKKVVCTHKIGALTGPRVGLALVPACNRIDDPTSDSFNTVTTLHWLPLTSLLFNRLYIYVYECFFLYLIYKEYQPYFTRTFRNALHNQPFKAYWLQDAPKS
jgi:hypothetical protein